MKESNEAKLNCFGVASMYFARPYVTWSLKEREEGSGVSKKGDSVHDGSLSSKEKEEGYQNRELEGKESFVVVGSVEKAAQAPKDRKTDDIVWE